MWLLYACKAGRGHHIGLLVWVCINAIVGYVAQIRARYKVFDFGDRGGCRRHAHLYAIYLLFAERSIPTFFGTGEGPGGDDVDIWECGTDIARLKCRKCPSHRRPNLPCMPRSQDA